MSVSFTLYHNPRCSKSRATLALLQNHQIELDIIEYLDAPPKVETLNHILTLLGLEPRDLMRTNEPEYEAANLHDESISRQQLVAAMVAHPILIQRPIVVRHDNSGDCAVVGRPPENVLELL